MQYISKFVEIMSGHHRSSMSFCNLVALLAMCFVQSICQGTADELVEGNTRFALDTYNMLKSEKGSVFFSPLSLSVVFGMLYEGSGGNTKYQIGGITYFDRVNNLASSFYGLSTDLNTPNENYTLQLANRLYASSDRHFLPGYMQLIRCMYQSDVIPSDFRSNAERIRQEINKWVEDKTNDKIKNLIPVNALTPRTAMVMVNAVYFKGFWANKFDAKDTRSMPFHVTTKKSIHIDMMYQNGKFKVLTSTKMIYQVLEMPYKGEDLSMYIILPKAVEGLARIEKLLPTIMQNIQREMDKRHPVEVAVTIPKFTIKEEYKMNDLFSKMGMPDLFTAYVCDLSGIDGTHSLYVSKMFHKSFIEVNEEGSEAAAATGVVIAVTSVRTPVVFKADHPFLFYIKDNRSGSILFLGKYVEP